jgi:hypothetical protein
MPRLRQPPPARRLQRIRLCFQSIETEPLTSDDPDPRVASRRHAAADPDRIVAAKAGHIDVRVGGKCAEVAGIAESPDRADMPVLEFTLAEQRRAVGE